MPPPSRDRLSKPVDISTLFRGAAREVDLKVDKPRLRWSGLSESGSARRRVGSHRVGPTFFYGRENVTPGRIVRSSRGGGRGRVLPYWHPRTPLRDITAIVRTLCFDTISGGSLSDLTLSNSKGFHITIVRSQNFKFHNLKISAPSESQNTDGIHVGMSTNVRIESSIIGTGDDCVSIGQGSYDIHVHNVTCGPGHGISIGSLGWKNDDEDVGEIHVKNCTMINTQNGVRIKTWPESKPSHASNITFEDIHMINVSHPMIIDQYYCNGHKCSPNLKPSLVQIKNVVFKNIWGTSNTNPIVTTNCSSAVPCRNVTFHGIDVKFVV